MSLQDKQFIIKFIIYIVWLFFIKTLSASPVKRAIEEVRVLANEGETVTLLCHSNDENHNFLYWHLNGKNIIIGPSNKYDIGKFRYEILSGNLTIRVNILKNKKLLIMFIIYRLCLKMKKEFMIVYLEAYEMRM